MIRGEMGGGRNPGVSGCVPRYRFIIPIQAACLLLAAGCLGSRQQQTVPDPGHRTASTVPLGWDGPIQALEVRSWTASAMEQVTEWTLAEPPIGVVVPDTVEVRDGLFLQRYAVSGTMFPDGRVLLLMNYPGGPFQVVTTTTTLEPFHYSPAEDEEVLPTPGQEFPARNWINGGPGVRLGEEFVVVGDPVGEPGNKEVFYLDAEGRLTRPPARVNRRMGGPLGAFADGSLLFWSSRYAPAATDTLVAMHVVSVTPSPELSGQSGSDTEEEILTFAVQRDPAQRQLSARSPYHLPFTRVGVSGDTIWAVPTERPALVAVHRSGEVLLRVDWEAGDRSVPNEERESVGWGGLERFPAASRLVIGSDGLVYVQRWAVRDGRTVKGPEWLVFNPSGELVGRLQIPTSLQVTAFGEGTVLASRMYAGRVIDTRIYEPERSELRVYRVTRFRQ